MSNNTALMTTKGNKSKNQISKQLADSEREEGADQSADQSNRRAQPSPGAVSDASMEVESDDSEDTNADAADTKNEKEARDESTHRTIPRRLTEYGPVWHACSLDSAGWAAARVT